MGVTAQSDNYSELAVKQLDVSSDFHFADPRSFLGIDSQELRECQHSGSQ